MKKLALSIICSLIMVSLQGQAIGSSDTADLKLEYDPIMEESATVPYAKSSSKKSLKRDLADRLLERADEFYDQMWFAEASKIYDEVLTNNREKMTPELLQRAGDAHYFNAEMDQAYEWYNKLFAFQKKDMGSQNLFKFSHTLKGTGRYAKAKRIIRLIELQNRELGSDLSEAKRKLEAMRKQKTVEIINLKGNSEYSDFSPMFYKDSSVVFASSRDTGFVKTRRYKWNNQPYLDLYKADVTEEKTAESLENIAKLSPNVNTKYHEAAVTFSPDGKTMYFTRNNYGKKLKRDKQGINHLKLFKSTNYNGEWSEAVELPFNSDEFSTGHPALSPDGRKLYFVSDMPGGFGETDIYVVDIKDDGSFSKPRNLGRTINSEKKEEFPFVTEETLYFSSNRPLGHGGLDVYGSNYQRDIYGVAINLGEPINSNKDDFSYIIDESKNSGFFASNRKGGVGDDDIYSFRELELELDQPNSAIVGVVIDKLTGNVMPEATVELYDADDNLIHTLKADNFGNFEFAELQLNTKYYLKASFEGYPEKTIELDTEDLEEISANFLMERVLEKPSYDTKAIYFDFERYSLRQKSKNDLDELAQMLNERPTMRIKIESHTDSRGSRAFNKWLSQERANETKRYLLEQGVAELQIESAIGYGEDRPINNCTDGHKCSSHDHQANRRSEFIITHY